MESSRIQGRLDLAKRRQGRRRPLASSEVMGDSLLLFSRQSSSSHAEASSGAGRPVADLAITAGAIHRLTHSRHPALHREVRDTVIGEVPAHCCIEEGVVGVGRPRWVRQGASSQEVLSTWPTAGVGLAWSCL